MRPRHEFFATTTVAMAHRGFHGEVVTENTLEAFDRAIALGYRYIESDLHLSADGVVVMAHDPDLARVGAQSDRIADLTWAQLSTRRLINGERVPRLDEALASWPSIHFNLDAKVHGVAPAAAEVIRAQRAQTRVCIGSFSHLTATLLRRLLPDSAHSASPREVLRWRMRRELGGSSPHAFMVPARSGPISVVSAATVARAHEQGRSVHVWTVNQVDQMRQLLRLGVDGLMTDRADLLKDVLISEGKWT